jgi:hypothetical protein
VWDDTPYAVTIPIDLRELGRCSDERLAALWHVAQVNPAPYGHPLAGQVADRIGYEIIRRWLKATGPELGKHRGEHYFRDQLTRFARYEPGSADVHSPEWHRGRWSPRDPAEVAAREADEPGEASDVS